MKSWNWNELIGKVIGSIVVVSIVILFVCLVSSCDRAIRKSQEVRDCKAVAVEETVEDDFDSYIGYE